MNWYHRVERRYVEYGSSFEATRAFGLFRATYDIVYNMNMAHLSHEVETFFEPLGDHGIRTACTPFLIYRGRTRHEVSLEGLLSAARSRPASATRSTARTSSSTASSSARARCRASRPSPGPAPATSTRPASKELVAEDAYDFLLFSLPDNDHHSHRWGPDATPASIAHADRCLASWSTRAAGWTRSSRPTR